MRVGHDADDDVAQTLRAERVDGFPIASSRGQTIRAIVSFTSITGGAPATSLAVIGRPRTRCMPVTAVYSADTEFIDGFSLLSEGVESMPGILMPLKR